MAPDVKAREHTRQRMISQEIEIERAPESHADLFSNCKTKKAIAKYLIQKRDVHTADLIRARLWICDLKS